MSALLITYAICTIISVGLFTAFCFSKKAKLYQHKTWQIIIVFLLFIVFSPICILTVIYIAIAGICKKIYYKKRPRPVPAKFRKYLKDDLVINEKGETINIDDYNKIHGTSYKLKDIYGEIETEDDLSSNNDF